MTTSAPRPLLPLEEALARLAAGSAPHRITATEQVSTFDALGRVLAADVTSLLDVPPADNTAMDGYALRTADVPAPGAELPVSQRIPAGVVGRPLAPGSAARIFTGAQVPPGADAVVMQEQCEALAEPAGTHSADAPALGRVRVNVKPAVGQWIRRRGEDVRQGAVVLARGRRLDAAALGLAASVGAASLTVVRRPRVALFSTGDELRMPGEPLPPGAIYNSNRFTLRGLAQAAGCEVLDFGIVPDRLDATRAALRRAAAECDLIVTSGGVSVGEEDHLKAAAAAEGQVEQWQVAMKPGKPLAFGNVRSVPFIGLPGNPVSSFVTFLLFARPFILRRQGADARDPVPLRVTAGFDLPRADKRREFLRARLNDSGTLELFPNQMSSALVSVAWADGLIDNPAGATIARGDTVRYLPLAALLV